MDSSPSENKAGGDILDLNSTASEQPETLTNPVDLGSAVSEVGAERDAAADDRPGVVGEQAEEMDAGHDDVEKKDIVDVGGVKVVIEAGDGKDIADGAVADAVEVKVAVEVKPRHADTDVADEKSMDKGVAFGRELGISVCAETDGGGNEHVNVGEQELMARRKRGRPRRSVEVHTEHACCQCPFQDEKKDAFAAPDLVWGKVRSHPWWPGQIFDPSDASEMASTIQKKDHLLVAYFGDKTFAWSDESQLKPFQTHFSQMEKQNSMEAFVTSVNAALQEVSRRMELGMTCHCFMDETYASLKDQKVENAGVQEGTCSSAVDKFWIVSCFDPSRLVDYIQTLAQFPYGEIDRLELVIAKSQLKAFYRSKGCSELPVFFLGEGLENSIEGSPSKKRKSGKDVGDPSTPTSSDTASGKGKSRVRGSSFGKEKHALERSRKRKSLSELMEKKSDHHDADGNRSGSGGNASSHSSDKKCEVADSDGVDSGKAKKKKLDSLGDLIIKSQVLSPKKQPKFGERMRRVAGQMTGSPPMLKDNAKTVMKSPTKLSHGKRDVGDDLNQTKTLQVIKSVSKDYSSPGEMLSQLCLAAMDPLEGYNFLSTIVSFFTNFRSRVFSTSLEDEKHTGRVDGKRGRRRSANVKSACSENTTSDCMQDSYWSGIIASDEENLVSSGQKRGGESQRKGQKKQSADEQAVSLTLSSMSETGQHLQGNSTNPNNMQEMGGAGPMEQCLLDGSTNVDNLQELEGDLQKEVDECMPTALVLTFNELDAIPAEADLNKTFGQYGPLREAETEVLKSDNHAKVVFKRPSDAEVALSSARKSSLFGNALVSYRLRFLELQLSKQDALLVEAGPDASVSVQEDNGAITDNKANGLAK